MIEMKLIGHTLWKIELYREYPAIISNRYSLRVYRAREERNGSEACWRWFFGFPKAIVEPLCPLLTATPYWGEVHCAEDTVDGKEFWLWYLPYTTNEREPDFNMLNSLFRFFLQSYNECARFLKKKLAKF